MTYRPARVTSDDSGNRVASCALCGYVSSGPRPNRWHDCPSAVWPPCGPGCQLKKSLAWWGIRDDGKCGCTEYAAEMDRDGPDGCEARIDQIVAHLVEQAAKKSVFLGAVPSAAVTVVVRRAIEAARAEATPPPG